MLGGMETSSRRDLFAAHALQGLLASGKFTHETEDGEWAVLDERMVCDEQGHETEKRQAYSPAVELAWRMAEWMMRDQPETEKRAAQGH